MSGPVADRLLIGLVSISDRASAGVYEDKGIPALQEWFGAALTSPWAMETRLIPDERATIEATLIELADKAGCNLVLTTGGTGPALRDVTPEATLAVADRVMPGFGEQMRQISLNFVPTAILSRQVAVVRGKAVMDSGTGTGIVAIAAKLAGAGRVVAVDVDRFATTACEINAAANAVSVETINRDLVDTAQPDIDVVVAGDVWYEQEPAAHFDAWFRRLRARVLTGDPGRLYVPSDLNEIGRFEVPASLDLENAPFKTTRVLEYPRGR
jgi:molybdenum cofactor synthesis domain-containing protein